MQKFEKIIIIKIFTKKLLEQQNNYIQQNTNYLHNTQDNRNAYQKTQPSNLAKPDNSNNYKKFPTLNVNNLGYNDNLDGNLNNTKSVTFKNNYEHSHRNSTNNPITLNHQLFNDAHNTNDFLNLNNIKISEDQLKDVILYF